MPVTKMTPEALIALFEARASAPPPEANQMLVRHLQCKDSLLVSRAVAEASDRYVGNDNQLLTTPTELLPPLA
ncbi:hypothetical protein DYQ86_05090 [Acidobacteria bacterium AB60]|nr:hypothetical protein DYQ86_05090 [Acidobacteria bacterium AB60]